MPKNWVLTKDYYDYSDSDEKNLATLYIMPSLLIMRSSRLWCLNRQSIIYDKTQTASEKQNISTKMRYSQLVNSGMNRSTVKGSLVQPTIIPLTN